MLSQLWSKSAERILLFLLVNNECYASQLQRVLHVPLTPLQKALERLEASTLLQSQWAGKTRIYTFNPAYPLLDEMEALLKKAYTLLPPREKSRYHFVAYPSPSLKTHQRYLQEVWERLAQSKKVLFEFSSKGKLGGKGQGQVEQSIEGSSLIFEEKGSWLSVEGTEFNFRNTFRWTLNYHDTQLTLEHLRLGKNRPVFLFHLVPVEEKYLESLHPHLCGCDTYFGRVELVTQGVQLHWRILGAKKNEEVKYIYI